MTLSLRGVWATPWCGVDLDVTGERVAVLADPPGAATLTRIVAGSCAPERGTARIAGADPARSPRLRARVGALLLDEELPDDGVVAESIRHACAARGGPSRPEKVLADFGLGSWGARRAHDLAPEETRAIALALALTTPDPACLVLCEPAAPAALLGLDLAALGARLSAAAEAGAAVVSITSSTREACHLGERVAVAAGGRIVRTIPAVEAAGPAAGDVAVLVVRSDRPEGLFAALVADPDRVAAEVSGRALRITTRRLAASARRVVSAALDGGIAVEELHVELPSAEAMRAAAVERANAEARAAFESAHRRAVEREDQERRAARATLGLPPTEAP